MKPWMPLQFCTATSVTLESERFQAFFERIQTETQSLKIGDPTLPRYRRPPERLEKENPQKFTLPVDYYRNEYVQACTIMDEQLQTRFDKKNLGPILEVEKALLAAANKEDYNPHVEQLKSSIYCQNGDVILPDLARHMPIVYDIVKRMLPSVNRVTTVCTICEAMNSSSVCKEMVPSVHNLLRLYLTVPVASATSERTFSALKCVLTSLRSSMTEKRLNNCTIPYIHNDLTDALDIKSQAEEFASRNQERIKYFGKFVAT